MPPRHAYWTIILEGAPTAFRAHTAEELLPTLKQLQGKHPDAVLKWFARGKLWHSPEEAQLAARVKQEHSERRPANWRPGGEHRDPRERFNIPRDEKRRRFAAKLRRDRRDFPSPDTDATRDGEQQRPSREEQQRPPREQREGFRPREERQGPPREQREGFRPREERQRPPREQREGFRPREERQRPPREQREGFRPRGDRPGGGSQDRRPSGGLRKWDQGDRGDNRRPREGGAPHGHGPGAKPPRSGDRRPWSDRPQGGHRNNPGGRGPSGDNRGPGGRGPGSDSRGPGGRGPGGGNRGPGGRGFGGGNRGPGGRGPGGGNRGPGGRGPGGGNRGPGGRGPGGGNRGGGPR